MARYLLDTNVIVDFSKGRNPATTLINGFLLQGDDIGVCAVIVAEFLSGVAVADRVIWRSFFGNMNYWTIDRMTAERAGDYRYTHARQGRQLGVADTLIAAVAYVESATVVTRNVKDFPMTDIAILVP
jgi:predicted nucleic acid-binding protein